MGPGEDMDLATAAAREQHFEQQIAQRGLEVKRMAQDGNCLFRCVADRVYGDAEMHDVVRGLCMDHVERERDHFSAYVTEDFDAYVQRKRRDRVHGNHLELQASRRHRRLHQRSGRMRITQAPAPALTRTHLALTHLSRGLSLTGDLGDIQPACARV